jgi:DNA polymerase V
MDAAQAGCEVSDECFALIDGNCFYCSCERVFDPSIARRPLFVLSNNDGCVISRTDEAKALGIRMGEPLFKIRDLVRRYGIVVRSSNYALYGDMSRRMNEIYATFSPDVEVYSIDESFLDLSHVAEEERVTYAKNMRETVLKWTGIPTCVGIGPTKTLAKVANKAAKKQAAYGGVCDLTDRIERDLCLDGFDVDDIWGVGAASAAKLRGMGIDTAGKLRDADPKRVRGILTVVGEKIVHELTGVSCMPMELVPPQRQGMAVTRGFSSPITDVVTMREAVSHYAVRLAEKLRSHGLVAVHGSVFMHTSPHKAVGRRHVAAEMRLDRATDDTLRLCAAAADTAARLWKGGYAYVKAGVVLTELARKGEEQVDLLSCLDTSKTDRVSSVLDEINGRFGRGMLAPASAGIAREWSTKAEMRSPKYTTSWHELPVVGSPLR